MTAQVNLFSEFKLGEPRPFRAVYQGIEYPGEVLVTETWRPKLGEIDKDIHFRIVVLTRHQQVPSIADRRIALCLPARAVKEEREVYGTGRKAKELLREQAGIYAAGQVCTKGRLAIDAREVFSAPDNENRFHLIASTLLSHAYPRLPIDTSALEKTLATGDVAKLFDGFFGKGDNPEAVDALNNFAVALGLAKPGDALRFDPEDCPLFPIIAERLEGQGGSLPLLPLYREIGSSYGLTWPLITLYLLCFVRYIKAVELRLKPDYVFPLRSAKPPPGASLTADLIPQIWWQSGLEEAFDRLCYRGQPSWSELLPYALLLCPELKPAPNLEEVKGQEALLLKGLGELKKTIAQIQDDLDLLSPRLGEPPQSVLGTLGSLSRIAQSKDGLHFYAVVQEEYAAPDALGEDISLCRALSQLSEVAGEILAVKSYLESAALRESERELDMDRVSILEQLRLDNLLPNLHLWASVKALFDWFKSRYRAIYLAHHHDYHSELTSLRLVLDDSKPEVDALGRLNSIAELGEPRGQELIGRYDRLLAKLSPCPIMDMAEVSVEEQPACSHCGLLLTADLPRREVKRFLHELKQALKEQHHRISSEAMGQILAQSGERRIDQFIKVVQTSDLSSLVNVLDDELVDFLRRLLKEAHIEIKWRPTLSEFAERFRSLEEGEIDAAAAEFARVLRKAFAKAKGEHPGKRVRLSFEE
ncbi:MAG: hypothetical protein ACE5IE_02945 [Dehalococcoidia bacterium]